MKNARTRLHDVLRRLNASLRGLSREKDPRLEHAFSAIEDFERLSGEVYRLRTLAAAGLDPSFDASRREAEDALSAAAHDLLTITRPPEEAESAYQAFVREYRAIWRRNLHLFLFTACVFVATVLVGWNIGINEPDYVPLFVDQSLMEMIHDQQAWFEGIQKNPVMSGFGIAVNNIKVAVLCFVLGAAFGLGSLVLMGYNGLLFGAILGYCRLHGFDDELLTFVAGHGPLELTIIVASCFAGLLIGRVFFQRPRSFFAERMHRASREAGILAIGIVPWLLLAAAFEAGISPWQMVPVSFKIAAGVFLSVFFWAWTFAESPAQAMREVRKSA